MDATVKTPKKSLRKILSGWEPIVESGRILRLERSHFENYDEPQEEDEFGEEVELEKLIPGAVGSLEEHPEGSDRGGYVPTIHLDNRWTYWDEIDGQWM